MRQSNDIFPPKDSGAAALMARPGYGHIDAYRSAGVVEFRARRWVNSSGWGAGCHDPETRGIDALNCKDPGAGSGSMGRKR